MKKRRSMSTTQIIALGFLAAILVGTGLLLLPISQSGKVDVTFVDALFTATTSVCVTGLTTVDTYLAWSLFGQVVILLLIQLGGLGIVTLTTIVMLIIGRRVTLKDRLLIEAAFNLDTLSGLVQFLRRVLKWTFATELAGAVAYSFVFIPEYGVPKGIWVSLFTAVSAFCNAGIDLFGADSLVRYAGSLWVNMVTIAMIFTGSLGFIVRWDIWRVVRMVLRRDLRLSKALPRLRLHSKIVLVTTFVLLATGTLAVFFIEYNNPATIGNMPFGEKLMASVFQSVTFRTAGFFTFSQKGMRDPTALIGLMIMFVGGSPVGTAGGVKTTTVALVVLAAAATAMGSNDSVVFRRSISASTLRKAIGVVVISFFAVMFAIFTLLIVSGGDFIDVAFEATSAIATVGLSRDYTRTMNIAGKLIIITCMYLGRIGPISLAIAFNFKKKRKAMVEYPEGSVTVG